MPKRKASAIRRFARRRNLRAKRIIRRRRPIRRRPLALKQHSFVERGTTEHDLQINTEASAGGHFHTFSLNQMKQQASYAALFEFYRIDKIVVTFRYKATSRASASYNTQNEVNPLLYFKVDHNDASADTLILMKDSMKTKTHMFTNDKPEFSIQLKPAIQSEMFKSSLTTAYTPKWGQWIPTDDPTVPHYALKCYAIGYKDDNFDPGLLNISYKYYVSFKNNE